MVFFSPLPSLLQICDIHDKDIHLLITLSAQAHALDIGDIQTPHGDFDVLLSKGLMEGEVFYSAQLVRFLRVDGVKHFMVVREARAPWPPQTKNARRNPYVMALVQLWEKLEKATVKEGFGSK